MNEKGNIMTTTTGFACELCGERHANGDPICSTVEPEQSSGYDIVSPQHGVWLVYDEETQVHVYQAKTLREALDWIREHPKPERVAHDDAVQAVHDLLNGLRDLRALRPEADLAAKGLLEQNSQLTLRIAENLGRGLVSFLDTIDGKRGA